MTVIGGYLGAGKTTLINHALGHANGVRLAVLVNDFGDINIDADLIAGHAGDTISLTNGCVCCSIVDELGDALDRVLAMPDPPDQILVEASGVADPDRIASYGRGWPGLRLDAVLVVADAETVRDRAGDKFVGPLVRRQLASADAVVLTKTDLVTDRVETVAGWIGGFAAGRPILTADHGRMPMDVLLEPRQPAGAVQGTGPHHDGLFSSFSFRTERAFDRARMSALLDDLPQVWRAKGFVGFSDRPGEVCLFQMVGRRWSLVARPDLGDRPGSIVAIGLGDGFDRKDIEARLRAALACPD